MSCSMTRIAGQPEYVGVTIREGDEAEREDDTRQHERALAEQERHPPEQGNKTSKSLGAESKGRSGRG